MGTSYFVSKKSIVNKFVNIGNESKIWHFCNIFGDEKNFVNIGGNTQIGSYCEIMPGVSIGDNCKIEPYTFLPEKTLVGNCVFIGPGTKVMNDKYPSAIKSSVRVWEPLQSTIGDKVSVGGGVIISPGITIGNRSVIGTGAVVTKNVLPYKVVVGNNRIIGDIRDKNFRDKYGELLG